MRDHDQQLPEAVARRVLTRAAELDASRRTSLSIPDLRAAAMEAGISSSALDQALNEVAHLPEVPTEPDVAHRPRRRLVAGVAIVLTLLALATSWIFMRSVAVEREAPPVLWPTPGEPPIPPPPPSPR